jgi:hypothetical protein
MHCIEAGSRCTGDILENTNITKWLIADKSTHKDDQLTQVAQANTYNHYHG